MPMKTWEPPPHQHDRDRQPSADRRDEPRNFESAQRARGADPDAAASPALYYADEDINFHGSEL